MTPALARWLPGYLLAWVRRPHRPRGLCHLCFAMVDHFEPLEVLTRPEGPSAPLDHVGRREDRLRLVEEWVERYPQAVDDFRDADGHPPRHTFFCSPSDYEPGWMHRLVHLVEKKYAEVEIHLHHRNDTVDRLRRVLSEFRSRLRESHGLLGSDSKGQVRYGFIHGNWALCNSRPDGDWCGVNEELRILAQTGAYADFTFPSAPDPTQPRQVNAPYRAWDRAHGRGADTGVPCRIGLSGAPPLLPDPEPLGFLIIPGPLVLDWHRLKKGVLPRLEAGHITSHHPPSPRRVDMWIRPWIHVRGRPEWVFVKVHCHGAIPSTARTVLGEAMRQTHAYLQAQYNDGIHWRLHYVTAREMYNLIRAAEAGHSGNPAAFRDFEIRPPPVTAQSP